MLGGLLEYRLLAQSTAREAVSFVLSYRVRVEWFPPCMRSSMLGSEQRIDSFAICILAHFIVLHEISVLVSVYVLNATFGRQNCRGRVSGAIFPEGDEMYILEHFIVSDWFLVPEFVCVVKGTPELGEVNAMQNVK